MNTRHSPSHAGLAWHYTRRSNLRSIMNSGVLKAKSHTGDFTVVGGELKPAAPSAERAVWFTTNQFTEPTVAAGISVLKKGLDDHRDNIDVYLQMVQFIIDEDAWRWARIGYPEHLLYPVGLSINARLDAHGMDLTPEFQETVANWRISRRSLNMSEWVVIETLNPFMEWEPYWQNQQRPAIPWPCPSNLWRAQSLIPKIKL